MLTLVNELERMFWSDDVLNETFGRNLFSESCRPHEVGVYLKISLRSQPISKHKCNAAISIPTVKYALEYQSRFYHRGLQKCRSIRPEHALAGNHLSHLFTDENGPMPDRVTAKGGGELSRIDSPPMSAVKCGEGSLRGSGKLAQAIPLRRVPSPIGALPSSLAYQEVLRPGTSCDSLPSRELIAEMPGKKIDQG